MRVGLVCIDVDGTLVGAAREVRPEVWLAAARARAAGIRLALCTGRPGFGITRELADRLDPDGWHGFQNGASVVELATGRSQSRPLGPELAAALVARAGTTGWGLELYTDVDYAFEGPPERARAHAALLGLPLQTRPFASLTGPIVRAQWLLPPAEAEQVRNEAHPGLEVSLSSSPLMPDTRFVNITAAGVDKASAVRSIAAEYGLPLEQVMFVGDSDNDATAMRMVGWPVAVANADAEILALARDVVGHVDAGGVREALELALGTTPVTRGIRHEENNKKGG